jgi:predicted dinucleotide-binding enzyme
MTHHLTAFDPMSERREMGMKVAIIGAGGMGGGIAKLMAAKHEILVGSRDPEQAVKKANELGAARGGGYGDVAAEAEVIFLTVPWVAVDETLAALGDLAGKILVDVTNPYVGGRLQLHADSSDAELIQEKVPRARVVKGWNTVFSPVLNAGPDFGGQAPSVFLAGDEDDAKAVVAALARDMGFDPIDAGPLTSARDLERLQSVSGAIGHSLEWGSWALKVLTR